MDLESLNIKEKLTQSVFFENIIIQNMIKGMGELHKYTHYKQYLSKEEGCVLLCDSLQETLHFLGQTPAE